LISFQDITSEFLQKNNHNQSQWITNRRITKIEEYPKNLLFAQHWTRSCCGLCEGLLEQQKEAAEFVKDLQ
jgi:hypothetical protein